MFLSSLIEELCTKEENNKAGCTLNFGSLSVHGKGRKKLQKYKFLAHCQSTWVFSEHFTVFLILANAFSQSESTNFMHLFYLRNFNDGLINVK